MSTTLTQAEIILRMRQDSASRQAGDAARRDLDRLRGSTDRVGEAQRRTAQRTDQLERELRQASTQAERLNRAGLNNRGLGQMGRFAQQAGLQVQDFVVQMSSGTSGIQAMTQNVPQLLGTLGPLGAGLGAVAAIAGAAGMAMLGASSDGGTLEDTLEGLATTVERLKSLRGVATDLEALREQYGSTTTAVLELIAVQDRLARTDALEKTRDLIEDIADFTLRGSVVPNFTLMQDLDVQGVAEAQALRDALNDLGLADSLAQQADATSALRKELYRAVGGVELLNDRGKELERLLVDAEAVIREAALQTEAFNIGLSSSVKEAADLAAELERAQDALARLTTSSSNKLAVAEINLQYRTDPVGRAGALAELEAQAAVDELIAAIPATVEGAAREDLVKGAASEGQRFVAERTQAAELDAERQRLDQLDREANRQNRGGGGGRGGRRNDRDVAGEIAAETAAIKRRRAAEAQSAEALREVLILEEQEAALKRAKLTLNDLLGGSEQARAQEIARQARALYEVQAAEEAAAAVSRAYAAEIGQSYADARAELEAWRDQTLLALDDGSGAHADLADEVEAIFNERLADAYKEDLARRTDWAAGAERAFLDVVDQSGSAADLTEEALTTAWRSGEDAIVSWATTGKIQVTDFVELALRQFYRLASATAVDLAGGGSGGLVGDLVGSLFGLGGTSTATRGVGGSSAAVLHGGGLPPDAPRVTVNPADFRYAPRYHDGLGPGETRAILKDDEAVLTAVQQQTTADSLNALVRLAGASGGHGGTGITEVAVHIHGVDGRATATAKQNGNSLNIDVIIEQIEARMGTHLAQGRGIAPAVEGRYGLQPKGAF